LGGGLGLSGVRRINVPHMKVVTGFGYEIPMKADISISIRFSYAIFET
jgi:hypothetical protein